MAARPRLRRGYQTPLLIIFVVALVAAAFLYEGSGANTALPAGARDSAPSQLSGSARDGAAAGDPHTTLTAPQRDEARPAGAVPDSAPAARPVQVRPAAREHSKPQVHQSFTGPAIDPKATEIPKDRTADTQTFQNPDGSRTLRVYDQQHNVRQPDGSWLPIDPTLVPEQGRLAPKTPGANVSFALGATDPALARLDLGGGTTMAYGLDGAAASTGKVDGAQITYAGVFPGVDLRLAATPTGLREQLVLAGKDAPTTFTYTLTLSGLTPRLTASGDVELVNGNTVLGVLPAGSMWDSAASPAQSSALHYRLDQLGQQTWSLRLSVDSGWLHDPARVFPVVVDPSATQPNVDEDDTYVRSDSPGNHSTEPELETGRPDGTGLARSYLHLGSALSGLTNDYIIGGTLNLKELDSTPSPAGLISAFEVTQPWSGSSINWPGPTVGRLLGQSTGCPSGQPCTDPLWIGIPFNPDVLTDWTHGNALTNGISVRAANEAGNNGMRYESADGDPASQRPFLDVRYAPEGASYQVTDVLQPTANQAGSMTVVITNRGATTWNGAYHFGYTVQENGAQNKSTAMPVVGPGQNATITAPIDPLTPGKYHLSLSMWDASGQDFAVADGVSNGVLDLNVNDVAPTSNYQQPGAGATVQTLTPTLYAQGIDPDNWPNKGLTYKFRLCDNAALTNQPGDPFTCLESGWGGQYWAPPAGALFWGHTYYWGVLVNDTVLATPCWVGPTYDNTQPGCVVIPNAASNLRFSARVAQPEITSHLAGSPGTTEAPGIDPQIGNYTVDNTDASVSAVGPSLAITRTYNSLDPRRDTAFGLGWASDLDMKLAQDADGSGNVVLTYPNGRQLRFGRNPDGSFASPIGDSTVLVYTNNATAAYTLRDATGGEWLFDASLRLSAIIDSSGLRQNLHYAAGTNQIDTITNAITNTPADRTLSLTWGDGKHVTAVAEQPPSVGAQAPTWTYTYTGDQLSSACAPGSQCTQYGYTAGSHYRSSVVDDEPVAYYRFDEPAAATTTLTNAVALHPHDGDATAHGVATDSQPGVLSGTSDGTATFDGNGYVNLPAGLTGDTMSLAAEMWFKTTGSGTLLSLQSQDFAPGAGASSATPVLYVGTDGLLYGGYPMQQAAGATQVVSPSQVNDGKWHHVVLSAAIGSQTLYLDGVSVGTVTGLIDQKQQTFAALGAGYAKGFPATDNGDFYFAGGSIDEAAIYRHPLGALAVAEHYAAVTATSELTSITEPQDNRGYATLTYDDLNDRVATLVDHSGLKWTIDTPTVNETLDNSDPNHPQWINPIRTAVVHGPTGYGDWTYTFDAAAAGRLISDTHNGATRSYEYNTAGFLSATVDADGNRTEQTTDGRGNVLSRKTCRAAGSCDTSYFTYVTPANPLDPRGNKLASSSDARSSGPTDTTYQTTYSYDAVGRPTGSTEPIPNGQSKQPTTAIAYSDGSQTAVDSGQVPAGLPISQTDERGEVTASQYFHNGDLAETDSPEGLRTRYTYDALGRIVTRTTLNSGAVAFGVTTYTYTPASQVASETDPSVTNPITGATHAQVTTYAYDADGNVTSITKSDTLPPNSGGDAPRVTTIGYDAHDRPQQTTNPDQGVIKYSYSADGLSTYTTDARGFVWTSTNDELGRLVSSAVAGTGVDPQDPSATAMTVQTNAYTKAGRLLLSADAMGRSTGYTYWGDGLLATTTAENVQGSNGQTRNIPTDQRTYDAAGDLTQEITVGGVTTATSYDPAGYPITATFDPAGLHRTTSYTRDPAGNPLTVVRGGTTNPSGVSSTSYTYDPAGLVAQETDQVSATTGYSTSYTRDERGLPTLVTDGRQLPTTYSYDATGALVTTTNAPADVWTNGQLTSSVQGSQTVGRNAFGEVTQSRDPSGGVTVTGRDTMGRVVSGTLPAYTPPGSTTPITATTTTAYDKAGDAISQTDPLNRTTTKTYDPYGRISTITTPQVGNTPSVAGYSYDRMGELAGVTTPSGAQHLFTYDQLGRKITSTQVDRSSGSLAYYVTTTGHDDAGNATSVTTPMNETTTTSYDTAGSPLAVTDPSGRVTGYTYDDAGRPATMTAPTGLVTSTAYDLLGRPTTVSQSSGGQTLRATTIGYDGDGNATSVRSPEGRVTTIGYDALNRPATQTEILDATHSIITSTGYDALGNRSHAVDGDGHATDYTSNPWGLPESTIEPATTANPNPADRTWTTSYDAAGQAVRTTAPGGIVQTSKYDAQGRLYSQSGTGAEASTSDRTLGYDLDGNVVSQTGPSGASTFAYDDRGNLLSYTGPNGSGTYKYNGDNETIGRTDAAGASTFGYDPAGRLSTVADPITNRTMAYGYDQGGRLASVTDNLSSQSTARTLTYDPLDRIASDQLTQVPEAGVPPVTKIGQTYSYDRDNNVTSKSDVNTAGTATNTYTYDGAGRLATWTDPTNTTTTYGFDGAGNRTSVNGQTSTYDQRNRLLSGGGATYTYTARGTLASTTQNGQTTNSTFDAFDRQITNGAEQFAYDSLDRLTTRDGNAIGYDGLTNNQVSADGRVINRLPDGTPLSDKASSSTNAGKAIFANQHGDVIGRYLGGIVDGQRTYDPFGSVTSASGETSSLGYQGDYTDPSTAQVDMAARWYTPSTGQFASQDSVNVAPNPSWASNKYAYGNANPVTNADPSGHDSCASDLLDIFSSLFDVEGDWLDAAKDLGNFAWSQTGGACAPPTASGCGDTITRSDGSPCPGFEVCDGSVVADWQGCAGNGDSSGAVDWCDELAGPSCHAAFFDSGGSTSPGNGRGISPIRIRPPQPPPPPKWLTDLRKVIPRPGPGFTITLIRGLDILTDPPPNHVIDQGPDITKKDTQVTQDPEVHPNAQQALPGYDYSDDESNCENGGTGTPNTIWYGPREPGDWKDSNGAPVTNPRTGTTTFDRATGAAACLRITRTGDRSSPPRPDGFDRNNPYANASGHLIAWIFYGGDRLDNLTPINQNKTNVSLMYFAVERQIRLQVEAGTPVYYRVTPMYNPNDPVPYAIHIYAQGNGFSCDVILQNSPVRDPTNRGCRDSVAA
ncbi:MAG TPA: RHS repeat-associated core domain-containing protein [Pseudonocardiaceae bacterium]|nr:RHS repeat-associated core domain-containing protein [Pseudonocardiaceae bacterium]